MGDSWKMKQAVAGTRYGGMYHDRIFKRLYRHDIGGF